MTTIEELPVPAEYLEASLRFRHTWLEYLNIEKEAKDEIVLMVKILEDEGYSRTKAIQKIVEDHKDLKGFSRATIYRELPDNIKRSYNNESRKEFYNNVSNVSNETFNKDLQNKDENVVNITTSQYNTQDTEETGEEPQL